jgi:hypothetical protein
METIDRSAIGPRLAVVLVLYFQSTRIFPSWTARDGRRWGEIEDGDF